MTRLNGTSPTEIRESLNSVTVVHQQGDHWRLLTVKREGTDVRVIETHDIPTVSGETTLRETIVGADADLLIRILPGGSVVCRTLTLPTMEDSVMQSALELQAEGCLICCNLQTLNLSLVDIIFR